MIWHSPIRWRPESAPRLRSALAASILAAAAMAAGESRGQDVVVPVGIVSSTAGTDYYPAVNLINGSGLSAVPTAANLASVTHAGAGAGTTWVTASSGPDWFASGKAPPVLTLSLSGELSLSALVLWGYPIVTSPNNNEAKALTAEFSTDGGTTWGGAVSLTHRRTAPASEVLPFAPRRANAVRLTVTDNHYGSAGASGGDRVGLGEIRFLGTTEIPPHPRIRVASGIVDFGRHAADPGVVERRLVVANEGLDQPLVLGDVELAGPEATLFRVEAVPPPIAAGTSAEVVVSFRPGARTGGAVGWLKLKSNDPGSPVVEIALLGAVADGAAVLPPPSFSHPSGTFADDFSLDLPVAPAGAVVVFTIDGSDPLGSQGRVWSGPLPVTRTLRVRAVALAAGGRASAGVEAGFIKLSPALRSKTSPLPILVVENFGAGPVPDKKWTTSTQTGAGLKQVRRQPVLLSLHDRSPATGRASLLGPSTLASRAGVRVRGAFSSTWFPQPYSVEAWDGADQDVAIAPLGLPAESDWVLYHPHPDYDATLIFNTYIWELSRRTGRYAPAFRHVEVYVNENGSSLEPADRRGLYALVEEVKRDPARLDFDPLSDDGTTGGWLHSINRMDPEPENGFPAPNGALSPQFFRTPGPNRLLQTVANQPAQVGDDLPRQYNAFINFESPGGYDINPAQRAAIEGWFREFENVLYDPARWRDPVNGYRHYLNTRDFIDYFQLLNLARQGDGLLLSMFPWVSSDRRQLHMGPMWDFNNGAYHLSGPPASTLYFRQDQLWYPRLFSDPDFLMEYIDRWFELRRGPYATSALTAIADTLAADITPEMATAQGLSSTTWTSRLTAMKNFLVQRANWIDTQYVQPPAISPVAGPHPGPLDVTVAHHPTATGTLYVSTDGRDPREPGGSPRVTAYTGPIPLAGSAVVMARTRTGTGRWSGLATATFLLAPPASAETVVISEIHYNPPGAGDVGEFLELTNVSAGPADLTGAFFDRGIQCRFSPGTILAPGERALVAARTEDFAGRPGVRVIGLFEEGSRLDNGGEWIRLRAWNGAVIAEFAWDDEGAWPRLPDGQGPSLTLVRPTSRPDPANPVHWRASTAAGGTPGASDARVFSGDPASDSDGDGVPDLCAHAFGVDPSDGRPRRPVVATVDGGLIIRVPVDPSAEDVLIQPMWSADLKSWEPLGARWREEAWEEDAVGGGWRRYAGPDPAAASGGFLRVDAVGR